MLGHHFDDALVFAADLHREQVRKGSRVPYLSHLMSVSALVLEQGGTETEATAALLHDAIEDAKNGSGVAGVRAEILERFGDEVLVIVEGCTDADASEKSEEQALPREARRARWKARKERYLQHLAEAPGSVLLVSASDKVHNARAIIRDVQVGGRSVFERFLGGEEGNLWYYGELARALKKRVKDEPRIDWLVGELERLVAAMQPG